MIPLLVMGAAAVAALAVSKKKSPEVERGETLATPEKVAAPKKMPTSISEMIEKAKEEVKTDVVRAEKVIKQTELNLDNLVSEKVFFEKPYTGTSTREELILPKEAIEKKKAEKEQPHIDIPLVVATKKDVTLNDLVIKSPARPDSSRPVVRELVKQIDHVHKSPNIFGNPDSVGFYRLFQTPQAHDFASKLHAIGFGNSFDDIQEDMWDKLFIWLERVKMPDMAERTKGYYPYERAKALVSEAEARGLFTDASFESFKKFLAETKGYGSGHFFLKES